SVGLQSLDKILTFAGQHSQDSAAAQKQILQSAVSEGANKKNAEAYIQKFFTAPADKTTAIDRAENRVVKLGGDGKIVRQNGIEGANNADRFKALDGTELKITKTDPTLIPGVSAVEYKMLARDANGNVKLDKQGNPVVLPTVFHKKTYDPAA